MPGLQSEHVFNSAKVPRSWLLAVFIISAVTICFEILLGRVFTFSYYSVFGFMIITTAMFGVAAGGVALHLLLAFLPKKLNVRIQTILLLSTFGLGAILPFVWYFLNRIPLDPHKIFLQLNQLWNFVILFFLTALPFFFASLAIGSLFVIAKSHVGKIYAFDLAGAGLGGLLPALLIAPLTPAGIIKASAVLCLMASLFIVASLRHLRLEKMSAIGLLLQLGTMIWAFVAPGFDTIYVMPSKPIVRNLKPEDLQYTRWSALGRIDLYDIPEQNSWGIEYDGGMGHSQILRFDGDLSKVDPYNDNFVGGGFGYFDIFFTLRSQAEFLALGMGGGMEVIAMLRHQPHRVEALEINPILVRYLKNELAEATNHVFIREPVHLILDDARSFIERTNRKYDFITLFSILTEAAYAGGANALIENYVETKEAYVAYLQHLKPDGFLIVRTHNDRIIPTIAAALREIGQLNYAQHLAIVGPYIAIGRQPISASDLSAIRAQIRQHQLEPRTHWLPDDPKNVARKYAQLLTGNLDDLVERQSANFAVATDDLPFFNEYGKWRNFTWKGLLKMGIGVNPPMHIGGTRALVVLIIAGILGLLFLVVPVLITNHVQRLPAPTRSSAFVYCAAFLLTGIGYIVIELLLISRLTLYIGHPVYTFAAVLCCMLMGSGFAGYVLDHRMEQRSSRLPINIGLAAAIFLFVALIGPKLHAILALQNVAARIVTGGFLAGAVGFALGQIFPLLLFRLGRTAPDFVPICWGLNGYGSVLGGPLSMLLLTTVGFKLSILSVVVLYALLLLVVSLAKSVKSSSAIG